MFAVITRKMLKNDSTNKSYEEISISDVNLELKILIDTADILLFVENGKIKVLKKYQSNITFTEKIWDGIGDMEKILKGHKLGWFD